MTDVKNATPAIPEFLVAKAIKIGIPTEHVEDEWADYVCWSESKYPGRGFGGPSWTTWCENSASKFKTLKLEDKIKLERAAADRQARREIADAEEASYARDAMTFGEYCALLERREAAGDLLGAHEADAVRFWETLDQNGRRIERNRPMALFGRFFAWLCARSPA